MCGITEKDIEELLDGEKTPEISVESNGKEGEIDVDINDDGKPDFKFKISGKAAILVAAAIGALLIIIKIGLV